MTITACPSLGDLIAAPDSHAEHLDNCRRCRALLRGLGARNDGVEVPAGAAAPVKRPPGRRATPELEPGAIWSFASAGDEYLIGCVLSKSNGSVRVAPLSDEVQLATGWDVFIQRELLGYPAMAQIWNQVELPEEQAERGLAILATGLSDLLQHFAAAFAERYEPPEPRAAGAPVLSKADPRLLFQAEERERVAEFTSADAKAAAVATAVTLGDLVSTRCKELAVERTVLNELADEKRWLDRLEEGSLDLYARLPVAALARLLTALRLSPGPQLEHLVAKAAGAGLEGERVRQAPVLARRRLGSRRQVRRMSEQERETMATDYARKVIEAMRS